MSDLRSFTIVKVTTSKGDKKGKANLGGRYISSSPREAVRKAASRICANSSVKGRCSLIITLRETTQGSAHKDYTYKVLRILDPVTVERDGVEVTYKYRTEVTSMN